jgi:hypothetical protein
MLDETWKEQIEFAFRICCHATLPLHSYRDKDNAFKFVRAYLKEQYVSDDGADEQLAFIQSVFAEAIVEDSDEDSE